MLDSTKRFSSRVENYTRYRPGYPNEIIDLLRRDCGLTGDSVIADVGSGTGKLTELFLQNGNLVFGVEPNREMREAGERLLKQFQNFTSVDGTAEATTLPDRSADFTIAGQAFHWFDRERCRPEFVRILKPGGWVAIIWNDRRTDATPFLVDYEKLLADFSTDYAQVNHRRVDDPATVREFFRSMPHLKSFSYNQVFDYEGLKGRLLSSSYAPEAGQPNHEAMLARLREIFDAHQKDGKVVFEYDTRVHYGRLA
ncbi:MAG: methyltransferase domain-containing protein [Verrucomicrobia bacterium]|nr:methyltransferase domain-containing protein [Verrucomicrobiota bacterium]